MKPFKGVISNWIISANHVFGECEHHTESNQPGGNIRTSEIITVSPIKGSTAKRLETTNSIYVLI